jgi:hypothetical protein
MSRKHHNVGSSPTGVYLFLLHKNTMDDIIITWNDHGSTAKLIIRDNGYGRYHVMDAAGCVRMHEAESLGDAFTYVSNAINFLSDNPTPSTVKGKEVQKSVRS